MISEDRAFSEIGHASLTVAEILALDVVQRASPLVLAGAEHLDRPVRWVHISEQPDIADYLKGSELLLDSDGARRGRAVPPGVHPAASGGLIPTPGCG